MVRIKCFLFEGLSENDCNAVGKLLEKPEEFLKGSEIYRSGRLGIIVSGEAKVYRKGNAGDTVIMRNIGVGDVFGAASMFGEWSEKSSPVAAASECEVCYIDEKTLRSIFAGFPQTAMNYISFLTGRIRFLNKKIDTFSAGSAERKIYEFLAAQADGSGRVKVGYGMAEMARRLKIGRTSLYRSLEVLENNGIVKRDKKIFLIK